MAGGVLNTHELIIRESDISGNSDNGVYNDDEGTLEIIQSTLTENGRSGLWSDGIGTIRDSSLSSNDGGGIRNQGTLTIVNSDISNNRSSGFAGGGIESSGPLTMLDSRVSGNAQNFSFGGIISEDLTLIRCEIVDNSAFGFSAHSIAIGGVYAYGSRAIIRDSLIARNTAAGIGILGNVGGIYNVSSHMTISNSTITGNSTSARSRKPCSA